MYNPGRMKEIIRDHVFLHFTQCKHILTLPNLHFDLEKLFIKYGQNVDCVEYKRDIYQQQLNLAPTECNLHYKNVKDMNLSKYDGIFLDFCGYFTHTTGEILEKIAPGTDIVITFMMRRESKKVQEIIDISDRKKSYINLLKKYNITVNKHIEYCDTTPMCLFFGKKN